MHATARRGGCGAQVDAGQPGPVRVPAHRPGPRPGRAEQRLAQRPGPAVDVPAHVVGVVLVQVGGGAHGPGQDQVAEPGGEPLDLCLDPAGHVGRAARGHVTVAPQRVLAGRSPAQVHHTRLGDQAVRPVRHPAGRHLGLAPGHFGQRAAEVHGARLAASGRAPRHRPAERPVHLAHPRPVAVAAQRPALPGGQLVTGQAEQLPRRHVKQHGTGRRQAVQRRHPPARLQHPAQLGQLGQQRRGDLPAAARHHRPAHGMRRHHQDQAERSRPWTGERQHRVGRRPGQQGPARLGAQPPGQQAGGQQPGRAEPAQGQRVAGHGAQRGQYVGQDQPGVADQRAEQPPVGGGVSAETARGFLDRTGQRGRLPAVERMGERDLGCAQRDPVRGQAGAAEEWGRGGQRVHRRADVVLETGQGQFRGPAAAARGTRAFDDPHRQAGPGHGQRRGQAVRPGADHDHIGGSGHGPDYPAAGRAADGAPGPGG